LRRGKVVFDLRHLGARRTHPIGQRPGSGKTAEIAVLKIGAVGLGVGELLLPVGELRIEEPQRRAGLVAITGEILFDEDVDQLLHHGACGFRAGTRHRDFEQIVLLRGDLDRLLQPGNAVRDVTVVRHGAGEIGASHDLFEIDRRGQRLADRVEVLGLVGRRDADLARQDGLHLHEHAGMRFVGVGNLRHEQPAEHGNAPCRRQRDPAPRPDRVKCDPDFVIKTVHSPIPLRTCSRG
jgi:hypothetical protein